MKQAIDVEPGDTILLRGEPRLILSVDVHCQRGDGIPDGYVRLKWSNGLSTVKATRNVRVVEAL